MVCPCIAAPLLMAGSGFTAGNKKAYIIFLVVSIAIIAGLLVYTDKKCITCPQ